MDFYATKCREKVTFKLEVSLTSVWLPIYFFIVVSTLVLAKNPHTYVYFNMLLCMDKVTREPLTFKSAKVN